MIAAQFLRNLLKAVPYTIHTVLTDNVLNARGVPPIGNSIAHRSESSDRWIAKSNEQSQRRGSAAQGYLG